MRQITSNAVNSFNQNKPFNQSNTSVKIVATENGNPCIIRLYLHNNMIAEKHINKRTEKLYITNAGWQSNTTKERLNALPNVAIQQKNWIWYLNGKQWDGSLTEVKNIQN